MTRVSRSCSKSRFDPLRQRKRAERHRRHGRHHRDTRACRRNTNRHGRNVEALQERVCERGTNVSWARTKSFVGPTPPVGMKCQSRSSRPRPKTHLGPACATDLSFPPPSKPRRPASKPKGQQADNWLNGLQMAIRQKYTRRVHETHTKTRRRLQRTRFEQFRHTPFSGFFLTLTVWIYMDVYPCK